MCKKEWVNIQTGKVLREDDLIKLQDNAMLKIKPSIWENFDFYKNDEFGLNVYKLTKGSDKKIWWYCDKCEQSMDRVVHNLVNMELGCPVCSGKRVSIVNCLATIRPDLLKLWNYDKNTKVTPYDFTVSSGQKVWWKCELGHEWKTQISSVTNGTRCPYCSNQKLSKDNSLAVKYPNLIKDWHKTKNGEITPYDVIGGGSKKYWWYCHKCKDSYISGISDKIKSIKSCPYCASIKVGKYNNLEYCHPEIAKEWDYDLNDKLPKDYIKGSHKKVWWKCTECEDSYEMKIGDRTLNNRKCIYCYGRAVNKNNCLQTTHSGLSKEWDYTKNGELTPNNTKKSMDKKVWWLGECGHSYQASISARVNNNVSCKVCSNIDLVVGYNDMWTTRPDMASMLLDPEDGYKHMKSVGVKLDWKCPKCDNIIRRKTPNNVAKQGLSCGLCKDSMSFGETIMYQFLKLNNIEFFYNNSLPFSKNKRYDFITNDTIIETHGLQHSVNTGFHKMQGKTVKEEMQNDKYKKEMAVKEGYKYFEIDVSKKDFNYVKDEIIKSGLIEHLNLNIDKFKDINLDNTLVLRCWDMWFVKGMKKVEIAKELKIGRNTVSRYIKLKEQTGS